MPQESCPDVPLSDEAPSSSERQNQLEIYQRRLEMLLCMVGQKRLDPESATRFIGQKTVPVIQSYAWGSAVSQGFRSDSDDSLFLKGIYGTEAELKKVAPPDYVPGKLAYFAEAEPKFTLYESGSIRAHTEKLRRRFSHF